MALICLSCRSVLSTDGEAVGHRCPHCRGELAGETDRITIAPGEVSEQVVQACLPYQPGDFPPETEIGDEAALRGDYERLRLAYRFQRYMGNERDDAALVRNILRLAFDLLPADRGAVLLRVEEGAPLTPAVCLRRDGREDEITIPDSILRRAVEDSAAVLSGDAMVDLRFQHAQSVVQECVRSAMCVPLVGQREVLGAIHLDTCEQTSAFTVRDLQLLSVLATQAASVLERARLDRRLTREAQARERLERFLSPEVLREVVERGIDLQDEGRIDRISVLFADIRGFTALAEAMPPHRLLRMLNAFFERMVDVVFRCGGVLDKFIGDALMAVWGAPIRHRTDAWRAVQAGRDMLAAVELFNAEGAEHGWPRLEIGIGVNTGEAVIGTVGSRRRMEYTVLGDAVNLAARVCALARGGQMLITRATLDDAGADGAQEPRVRALPPAWVRGRSRQVQVFEVSS